MWPRFDPTMSDGTLREWSWKVDGGNDRVSVLVYRDMTRLVRQGCVCV